MMERGIPIEVLGYKATIDSVSARQADGIWYKEDHLMVFIDLVDSAESVSGFGINLPAKRYGKEEFLAAVKAEAEATLPKLLEKHREERTKLRRDKEKQDALDLVVGEIKTNIGLQ